MQLRTAEDREMSVAHQFEIDRLAIVAAQQIDASALELLGAVVSDPSRGVPIAESAGIDQFCFEDDFRIIWIVADVGRGLDAEAWLSLARNALRKNLFWDDAGSLARWGSMQWNDATLAKLATWYPYLEANIRFRARKLIELLKTRRDAAEHLERARRLLAGEAA